MISLERLTLKCLLQRSVEKFPLRPALSQVDGTPITYAEFDRKVSDMSQFMHKHGIVAGDRVAILSENKPNWSIAYFAITSMGAIAVPILPDFNANEVHHIIRHADCKGLFVSERLYDKVVEGEFDTLKTIIFIDDFSLIPPQTQKEKLREVVREGSAEFARLKETALRMAGKLKAEVQEDDIASIIYTSGTTGHSKGVMLSHKNIIYDAIDTMNIQMVDEYDRLLSVLPLSHTYECTIGLVIPLLNGACVYYIDKPPTARVLLPAMQKVKPTMMLTVPLIMEKIFKMRILPSLTGSSLMRGLYKVPYLRKKLHQIAGKKLMKSFGGELHFYGIGGAKLSPEVERFLREAHFPYAIGYGLTETSPLAAGCGPTKTRFQSTGPALPGIEIKIAKPNPITGEGEILVRGATVMKGYFRDPERTAEVITQDGWFKTGDLGVLDQDGYLYIKGRLKNMIVGPSGENIYPEEIESIINESDYVLESIVFEQHGQIVARIHLNYEKLDEKFPHTKYSNSKIQEHVKSLLEEIRQDTNSRVSTFSRINTVIEQTEPFEKTPTQKIKRYLYVN